MKLIISILAFGCVASSAYAADFETTAIYCNGPVSSGDVSNCPSFSAWMGVSLKDLKVVSLPVKPTDSLIRLQDASGNIWQQSLETCKSRPSDLRGCSAKVDLTKPQQVSIHISIWDVRKPARNLALFINEQNQLSLLPEEGDNLMFSLIGK
jgi:hypothetical protein